MLNINDVPLEFDMLDADTMERYEAALEQMEQTCEQLKEKEMKLADSIRQQCQAIFSFFNAVFGEGTDKKLFGDKTNLGVCMDAYDIVIESANAQRMQYENRVERYYSAARVKR